MPVYKRRIKLIRPRLQLKLVFTFVGLTLLALMLQFLVFMRAITSIATELPADHDVLMEAVPEIVVQSLLLSFGIVLPLVFLVGVLVTFHIAGPVYRFEQYLKQVIRGEKPADCRLRKGDELQDLCALINQATAPLRVQSADETSTGDAPRKAA